MGFFDGIGEALFGTKTKAAGQALQNQAAQQASSQQAIAGKQALTAGKTADQYGQGVQQSMGANAGEYMQKQQAAAQGQAAQQANYAAQQATKQGVKAARTAGVNPGQAALMAGRGTADTYGGAYQQAMQQGMNRYGQATNQFAGMQGQMANQQLGQQQVAAGATGQVAAAGQNQVNAAQQQAATTWGTVGNLAGTAATMMATSDERAKKNIRDLSDTELFNSSGADGKKASMDVLWELEDRGLMDEWTNKYDPLGTITREKYSKPADYWDIANKELQRPEKMRRSTDRKDTRYPSQDENIQAEGTMIGSQGPGSLKSEGTLVGADKLIWDLANKQISKSKELKQGTKKRLEAAYNDPSDAMMRYIEDEGLLPNYKKTYYPEETLKEVTEKVRPVTFDYKNERSGTDHLGVVAQDLEGTALKNVVKEDAQGTKMIDTTELSPALLNLIIQLSQKVDRLGGQK